MRLSAERGSPPARPADWYGDSPTADARIGRPVALAARRLRPVAGRIRDEDIALVRERSRIAEIVGERVTLRNAGGGSLKGLCPFHEEKTPSFHVTPARNLWHCFGCQAGGDVFDFVMRVDHLTFAEAVEMLAARAGITLRYEEGGHTSRGQQGVRTRLIDAHHAAAAFYAELLAGSGEAEVGRSFLAERGFDMEAAGRFGVGYAPQSWDSLVRHLRKRGFTDQEILSAGLAREGQRGLIDRFRGRLMWPIREITGEVVGFGARRLYDEDSGPKYLNSPETPIFKKSRVLYGVDLAKREIARRMQAVIVEGYTDVMACHLAGVPTAVATCGTAFGAEHIRVLRRLLMDQNEFRGEVIFTFDGDEAGQEAARRAFEQDQRFVTQTFVAVEPSGVDPCELRVAKGDAAVRDLVASRVPLFEFAIRGILARYDLSTPEGRVNALRAAAPVVARIKDRSLRPEYTRSLAGWLGMEVASVAAEVASPDRPGRAGDDWSDPGRGGAPAGRTAVPEQRRRRGPESDDPAYRVEREALKLAVQRPDLGRDHFDATTRGLFVVAEHEAVRATMEAAGWPTYAEPGEAWVTRLRELAPTDEVRTLITAIAVELPLYGELDERYAEAVYARLAELATTRQIAELKSTLQRLNPVESPTDYNRLFAKLIELEAQRRNLRERAIGGL